MRKKKDIDPEEILIVIVSEIDRQIAEKGFALKWYVHENIREETGLSPSTYERLFKMFIVSGRLGYQYLRPAEEQRQIMGGQRLWIITKTESE